MREPGLMSNAASLEATWILLDGISFC